MKATLFERIQHLEESHHESLFLWGARQTGKSTLLKQRFPHSPWYDLLHSDQFERLSRRPALLREELLAAPPDGPVVIDEIQKLPPLLDEVQGLIVHHGFRFVLSGSSARKLRRTGANLLGGRAIRCNLCPLVSSEIPGFDLVRAVNHGLLPRHYLSNTPHKLLQAYVGDYLREEIRAEALVRNIGSFSRFLEVAALSNGEVLNYLNVARECGVSAPTAKAYFEILEDTLLGFFLPAYVRRAKRRIIQSPKFYFFDVGMANHLLKRPWMEPGTELFGRAFEHLIIQELSAWQQYSRVAPLLSYWRTSTQLEVDCVLGDAEVAIEIKASTEANPRHAQGLRAFKADHPKARLFLVSMDPRARQMEDITVLPWQDFFDRLWSGRILEGCDRL